MLQNKLTRIKGQLLEMFVEMYRDMNSDENGVDYESFFEEVRPVVREISDIQNIGQLELFCEGWGLNDEITNPMSFPALVAEAYKE